MPAFDYEGQRVTFTGDYSGSYDCINKGGFYEAPFLEHVRSLGLGGTYLDIGTNIGNHAVYFARFCGAERVIGFEPVPHWRARAEDNLRANDMASRVRVIPYGLSDRREEIRFAPYGTEHWLQCAPLDDFLPAETGITFVKMDIEGSEPKALLGGRRLFQRNRPVIYAECLGSPDALLAAAAEVGYRHSGVTLGQGSPMLELVPA